MPQLFVPNATPQLGQQGFTTGKIDTSITNRDTSKALDPMVKAAEAYEAYDIKMQEQADDTAALTAINNFTAASQKRYTDLASKENEAAEEDYKTFDSDIDKFASQFSAGLNPRAARKYQEQVAKLSITSKASGYAFNVNRIHTQEKNELSAAVLNGQQQAVSAFGTAAFGAQMSFLDENTDRLTVFMGLDPNSEQGQAFRRKAHADVYKTAIDAQITSKNFGGAARDLSQFGGEMDQFDRVGLEAKLTGARIAEAKADAARAKTAFNQQLSFIKEQIEFYSKNGYEKKANALIEKAIKMGADPETVKFLSVKSFTQVSDFIDKRDAKILSNGGMSPQEQAGVREEQWQFFLYGKDGQDGKVTDVLLIKGLPFTAENKAKVEKELRANPKFQAQIESGVQDISRAEFERVNGTEGRLQKNFNYAMDEINKGILLGEINPAAIANSDDPMSVLPQIQKKIQALYPNPTEEDQKEIQTLYNRLKYSLTADVIGNEKTYNDLVAQMDDDIIRYKGNTTGLNDKYRRLHVDGELSLKQTNALETMVKSKLQAKYDKARTDITSAVQNLIANKMYDVDKFSQCTPSQRIAILNNVSEILDAARKETNYSNDPNALQTGIILALKNSKLLESLGLSKIRSTRLSELMGDGDLGGASDEAVENMSPEDKLKNDISDVTKGRQPMHSVYENYLTPKFKHTTR